LVDWEYHLWTDTNLPDIEPITAYTNMIRFNGKADILRWQLLKVKTSLFPLLISRQTYGGVWIDADTVCLKPVDELIEEENDLFLGNTLPLINNLPGHHHWMNPNVDTKKEKNHGLIANSIVGSIPSNALEHNQ
jgi:mannosyltransferase OCH1-like enzyme